MMKHIWKVGTVAAALAASMVLVSTTASAQAFGGQDDRALAGGPAFEQYRHGGYDDRGRGPPRGAWTGRAPDFQTAQRECSRAAIEDAWRRGDYSAQYEPGPKMQRGHYGYEFVGKMRLHNRKGIHYVRSVCELRPNGYVASFHLIR